jgi:hypothetical protein
MPYTEIPVPPGAVEVERWLHGETDVLLYFASRELGEQFIAQLEQPEGFDVRDLDADDTIYSDSTVWDHVPARADIWVVSAHVWPDKHKQAEPKQKRIWEFSGFFAERTGPEPYVKRTKPSRSQWLGKAAAGGAVSVSVTVSGLDLDQCLVVLEEEITEVQQELNRLYEPVETTAVFWKPRDGVEIDVGSALGTLLPPFSGEVR